MARDFTIRYRQDGDGWWYEIRDSRRKLVRSAWRAGATKQHAQDEATRERDRLRRAKEAA
jgi:hypothetical protein